MHKELSNGTIAAVVAAVIIIIVGAGYFLLRDRAPTTAINSKGREQLGPPPAKVAVPDWVRTKLQQH